ncbi:MAG: hypothetical protein HKN27_00735 [Silicimonas sp.]|nr:hypothetical protein [Silicimonas sp.]
MLRKLTPVLALLVSTGSAFAAVSMGDVDIDGDSFASYAELKNAMPAMDMRAFRDIDANNDNRISSQELLDSKAQSVLAQHQMLGPKERPLAMLDADGDGFMSLADIQQVHPDFTVAGFEQIDTNNDQRLSYQEYYTTEAQTVFAQCGPSSFADIAAIDSNNDKFADFNEVLAAYPKMDKYDFDEMDANGDNRVSSVEWLAPRAQCILDEH